ncbi:long-chain-fatty-acid--CoA ligase 5-like, partial [Parasteatoda tepidariorum]|uniref:long-chain-fatty-acid--CoA ligase 5-like n=1 Tax=Parasteatoda tepidariorum TaxID=114398 RepID=UPI0039BCB08D
VESQIKMLKEKAMTNGTTHPDSTNNNNRKNEEILYDPMICKSVADSLGGRIKLIISGAAPISDHILKFYLAVCNCEVMEVYGQTECGGPSNANILTPETV